MTDNDIPDVDEEMEAPTTRRNTLKAMGGAGIAFGAAVPNLAFSTQETRTLDWDGHGSEHAEQVCDGETAVWHWILTPGGSTPIEDGAELTVEFDGDSNSETVEGYRPGQGGGGAVHFEVTKDGGGTVSAATAEFVGGGDNVVLTISEGECAEPAETEPPEEEEPEEEEPEEEEPEEEEPPGEPEEFDDLAVTQECRNGDGVIAVSNSNDDAVTVTVTGPDGYEASEEVPAGGTVEFAGLENGTYELSTDSEDVDLDRTTVEIDY